MPGRTPWDSRWAHPPGDSRISVSLPLNTLFRKSGAGSEGTDFSRTAMPLYSNVFSLYREWPGVPSVQLKRNRLPVKVQPDVCSRRRSKRRCPRR